MMTIRQDETFVNRADAGRAAMTKLVKTRVGHIDYNRLSRRLSKRIGCDPDDDQYYHAPVTREVTLVWPKHGINESEIVALTPAALKPRPAIWKPEDGEDASLVASVGGPLCVREEAAYLIDRALGYYLVPLSYVAYIDGKRGAVVHYVPPTKRKPVVAYSPEWTEKGAIYDYILAQLDRRNHNWMTNIGCSGKMVLYDHGYSLPVGADHHIHSAFVDLWRGKALSDVDNLERVQHDTVLWTDVKHLVGSGAMELAKARLDALIGLGAIPNE